MVKKLDLLLRSIKQAGMYVTSNNYKKKLIFSIILLIFFIYREPNWSYDEKLFAIQISGKVLIYEDGNLERYTQQIQAEKLKCFSLSPSTSPYYFSIFTLG